MFLLSWIYYLLYLLIIFASKKKNLTYLLSLWVQYKYMYRVKHVIENYDYSTNNDLNENYFR